MDNQVVTETYAVKGMTCAACASNLETHLKTKNGIKQVSVNYGNNSAYIEFDPAAIALEKIQKAADEIGYHILEVEAYDEEKEFTKRLKSLGIKLTISAVLSLPVFLISMFFKGRIPFENWILLVLSTPVLIWSGSEFFINAFKKLKHLTTNMDTLVAMSTGAAYLFSVFNTVYPEFFFSRGLEPHVYFESAVVIITLILLGRYFEERAKFRTTGAIKKLMGIQPRNVRIHQQEQIVTKPVEEVKKGEVFSVRPGEKIALDGYVVHGNSYVDESMINGEPVPSIKSKDDYVYAGTVNQNGILDIIVEKESGTTLLAQIIELVKKAQASKPPIQKTVDKIASIFVPTVIIIALLSFFIWYLVGPEPNTTYSFLVLITVLIIACPCAMGLATPTALMVGIGKGAEKGILIKDAESLETAHKIDTLVLDKTGTITKGKPEVLEVRWHKNYDKEKIMRPLLLLESKSEHPLAKAMIEYLGSDRKNDAQIEFLNIPGSGITGLIDGKQYYAGNKELIKSNEISVDEEFNDFEQQLMDKAYTIVYFANEMETLGIFGIRDPYRDGAKKTIIDLQNHGIDIVLLSGDNKFITEKIANELNIKAFKGGMLPNQKGVYIKELKSRDKVVAMAGDGINDAHALAEADIGIAMGSGTDIAMESAGITLMQSDIHRIRDAVYLSKATVTTINQNLFWAFAYNILAIPIAAGILFPLTGFLLNPMIAGAAMAFSSVSVVTNSLRLKKKKL
jgi:Cu2+-exporting ATPase